MTQDMVDLVNKGELTLRVRGGDVCARFDAPANLCLMAARGLPPECIQWGSRFFMLNAEGRYVEGLLISLFDAQPKQEADPK